MSEAGKELDEELDGERIVGFDGALDWLEELITSPWPSDKEARLSGIEILKQSLTRTGVDVESLVRYGLAEQITGTLLASLILDSTFSGERPNSLVATAKWRELLQIPFRDPTTGDVPDGFNQMVTRARASITDWVKSAPFAEILAFLPPTEKELQSYMLRHELSDESVAADYVWIWQRTRVDELYRWSDESLFKEFRWRDGATDIPFPVVILEGIGPDIADVNQEIARRAAYASSQALPLEDPLVWQMQYQALKLLNGDRSEDAAALFEFYLDLHPDHAVARNNLGFCRIPISPESALHHLRLAEKGGFHSRAINVVNQCCCLTMLSREGEALDRAEYYWQREHQPDHLGGYLWAQGRNGWELSAEQNPNLRLARLALDVATALGRTDRVAVWSNRIDEIVSTWTPEAEEVSDSDAA